jgi:hypothetical protein
MAQERGDAVKARRAHGVHPGLQRGHHLGDTRKQVGSAADEVPRTVSDHPAAPSHQSGARQNSGARWASWRRRLSVAGNFGCSTVNMQLLVLVWLVLLLLLLRLLLQLLLPLLLLLLLLLFTTRRVQVLRWCAEEVHDLKKKEPRTILATHRSPVNA